MLPLASREWISPVFLQATWSGVARAARGGDGRRWWMHNWNGMKRWRLASMYAGSPRGDSKTPSQAPPRPPSISNATPPRPSLIPHRVHDSARVPFSLRTLHDILTASVAFVVRSPSLPQMKRFRQRRSSCECDHDAVSSAPPHPRGRGGNRGPHLAHLPMAWPSSIVYHGLRCSKAELKRSTVPHPRIPQARQCFGDKSDEGAYGSYPKKPRRYSLCG